MKTATYITTSWDDGHPLDLRVAGLLAKYGLRGLKERAAFLGGAVTVAAGRNGGTVVSVQLPLTYDEKNPVGL